MKLCVYVYSIGCGGNKLYCFISLKIEGYDLFKHVFAMRKS